MNKESILYGTIGLLVGILVTILAAQTAVNGNNVGVQRFMGMHIQNYDSNESSDESMGMDEMAASLNGKSGDDFDKLFLAEMIVHHQGAIDMAELAKKNAKHDELKNLADSIITAQTAEIKQMRQWQLDWDYATSDNSMGGMHR